MADDSWHSAASLQTVVQALMPAAPRDKGREESWPGRQECPRHVCPAQIRRGTQRSSRSAAYGVIDGQGLTSVDINPIRQAQKSLRRMSKVFTDFLDPMVIFDLENRIMNLNDEMLRSSGWTREELLGKPAGDRAARRAARDGGTAGAVPQRRTRPRRQVPARRQERTPTQGTARAVVNHRRRRSAGSDLHDDQR